MGQLLITMGTTAAPRTRTRTIADALFASRIVPAMRYNYGQVFDPTLGTPVGTPPTPPGAFRDRTANELLDLFATSVEQSLKDMVKRFEADTAKVAAESAVTELPTTP